MFNSPPVAKRLYKLSSITKNTGINGVPSAATCVSNLAPQTMMEIKMNIRQQLNKTRLSPASIAGSAIVGVTTNGAGSVLLNNGTIDQKIESNQNYHSP